MKITVNDISREIPEGTSLQALLLELGLDAPKGLAVAVNRSVVPVSEWEQARLNEGDSILMIQATQGG
jgi:sulfur carrier protein